MIVRESCSRYGFCPAITVEHVSTLQSDHQLSCLGTLLTDRANVVVPRMMEDGRISFGVLCRTCHSRSWHGTNLCSRGVLLRLDLS